MGCLDYLKVSLRVILHIEYHLALGFRAGGLDRQGRILHKAILRGNGDKVKAGDNIPRPIGFDGYLLKATVQGGQQVRVHLEGWFASREDAKGGADAIAYPVNLPDNILAFHTGKRLVFRIAEGTGEVTPGETNKDRRRPGKDTLPLEGVKNLINAVNFHNQSFS